MPADAAPVGGNRLRCAGAEEGESWGLGGLRGFRV